MGAQDAFFRAGPKLKTGEQHGGRAFDRLAFGMGKLGDSLFRFFLGGVAVCRLVLLGISFVEILKRAPLDPSGTDFGFFGKVGFAFHHHQVGEFPSLQGSR